MDARNGEPSGRALPDAELVRVLREAAAVAAGDADHDLISTLHVLNTDVLGPTGRPQLYEPELRQIARALCATVPESEAEGGPTGREVALVNAWVARRRGGGRHRNEARDALVRLFTDSAQQIEIRMQADSPDVSVLPEAAE